MNCKNKRVNDIININIKIMALIKCTECGKEISDKAVVCPNCGFPIENKNVSPINTSENKESQNVVNLAELSLSIGQNVTSLGMNVGFEAILSEELCTQKNFFSSGVAKVLLHTHGIEFIVAMKNIKLHNSQIINIKKTSSAELKQVKNSSVIGRAAIGNLIMGQTGALIGGLSALETNEKLVTTQFITINYWDIPSKTAQTLILTSQDKEEHVDFFLDMREHEMKVNEETKRLADNKMPLVSKICAIITGLAIIAIIVLNFIF